MAKYGMAIDLNKCVGCGACALACKAENNTDYQHSGQKFNWADFFVKTEGTFVNGDVRYTVYPVLCNHCSDAPCVENCPVTPKAMYKTEDGITMHNNDLCVGCQLCQVKCPYSATKVLTTGEQYSIISYNRYDENSHGFWDDTSAVIPGGTSSPAETASQAGIVPPYKNEYTHPDYLPVRPPDVTEKCIFCDHRLKNGQDPFCVVSCPSGARVFGDLNDPTSEISQAIAGGYKRFKNNLGDFLGSSEAGTQPNVFYIGDFGHVGVTEFVATAKIEKLKVYPNPVRDTATIEFELTSSASVNVTLFDISGKLIRHIVQNQTTHAGNNSLKMDVNGLKPGTYIVVLLSGNQKMTANLIVTN